MKNILKSTIVAFVLAFGIGLTPLSFATVFAAPASDIQSGIDATKVPGTAKSLDSLLSSVINILLFIIGATSVIMLIIGGIKYTTSNGDATQVTSAKNTILYAIVGMVVAFSAFAIVNWVLKFFVG